MSKVIANGLAVATSTTGHVAHVLPPGDIRLVTPPTPPVPTPLWNQVESKKIYTKFPTKTQFESGNIWVLGTQAGPLSDPTDGFLTPKGALNSWACGASFSGSPNVVVEAKKVFRFTDYTMQNQYNSLGMINDAAGAAAARAAFEESLKKNAPVVDADGSSGSGGKADGETGKGDGDGETETEPSNAPAPEECEVAEVKLTDKPNVRTKITTKNAKGKSTQASGPRSPAPKSAAADESVIQVLDGSEVTLEAKLGKTLCGADKNNHAEAHWKLPDGSTKAGAKITWKANRKGAPNKAGGGAIPAALAKMADFVKQGNLRDMIRGADVNPVENVIVCHACKGNKTRKILAFPADESDFEVELFPGVEIGKELVGKLKNRLGLDGELKTLGLKISGAAAWTEQSDHTCEYAVVMRGSGDIIKGKLELRTNLLALPWPIPPLKAALSVIEAINDVCEFFTNVRLVTTYFRITLELSVSMGRFVEGKKKYKEAWRVDVGGDIKGDFTPTLALGVGAVENMKSGDAMVRAEVRTAFPMGYHGKLSAGVDAVRLQVSHTLYFGPIKFTLELSWNLLMLVPDGNPNTFWGKVTAKLTATGVKAAEATMRALTGYGLVGKKAWDIEAMAKRELVLERVFIE